MLYRILLMAMVLCSGLFSGAHDAVAADKNRASSPMAGSVIAVGPYDSPHLNALSAIIAQHPGGVIAPAQDSFAAITKLRDGAVDAAIVPSDIVWAAMKSRAPFIGKPNFDDVRIVGTITDESFVMLTRQLRGLRRIAQMENYRVGIVGNTYDIFDYILEVNKMASSDMEYIRPFTPAESVEAICSGEADMVVGFVGQNDPYIREMYNRCPIMFAPLDYDTQHQIIARYTYFAPSSFNTKWYHPTAYVHETFGRGIMLIVRKNTPADIVDYWEKALAEQSKIGGNAPWLVSGRSARNMAQMYGLPVHERLALSPQQAPQTAPKAVAPAAQPEQKAQPAP